MKIDKTSLEESRKWEGPLEEFKRCLDFLEEEALIPIIQNEPELIRFISFPSPRIQMEVVKQDPYLIRYIDFPTEQVQAEAILRKIKSFILIDNPFEEIKQLFLKLTGFEDVIVSPKIGSRNSKTIVLVKNGFMLIKCGCFCGILEEFEQKVKDTYTTNCLYFQQYMYFIDEVKKQRGINEVNKSK